MNKPQIAIVTLLLTVLAAAQQKAVQPAPAQANRAQTKPASRKPAPPANTAAPSSSSIEATSLAFAHTLFGYNPELQLQYLSERESEVPGFREVSVLLSASEGQQVFKFLVTPDGQHALVGDIMGMSFSGDPFGPTRQKLEQGANGPARGPKGAKVKVVEFADLQCPSCKLAQPNIQKLAAEEPGVEIIFQNFPIAQLHKWARRSAAYVDCMGRTHPDVAIKFIDTVYAHQEEINETTADEKLKAFASQVGADPQNMAACIAAPETGYRIDASYKLGEEVGVTGTPTVFINGRRIANFNSVPYDVIKQLVDFAQREGK